MEQAQAQFTAHGGGAAYADTYVGIPAGTRGTMIKLVPPRATPVGVGPNLRRAFKQGGRGEPQLRGRALGALRGRACSSSRSQHKADVAGCEGDASGAGERG